MHQTNLSKCADDLKLRISCWRLQIKSRIARREVSLSSKIFSKRSYEAVKRSWLNEQMVIRDTPQAVLKPWTRKAWNLKKRFLGGEHRCGVDFTQKLKQKQTWLMHHDTVQRPVVSSNSFFALFGNLPVFGLYLLAALLQGKWANQIQINTL